MSAEARRERMRALAVEDPAGWCETLYAEAGGDPAMISWADLEPHPVVVAAASDLGPGAGRRACVVGCGLGDDATFLADHGWSVTAFDLSPTAIDWCKRRYPDSSVAWFAADLFGLPSAWARAFGLVVEVNTLQVLPADVRVGALAPIASLVGNGGTLVLACRARHEDDPPGQMPWPLTEAELSPFHTSLGLQLDRLDEITDSEDPPVRRFVGRWTRP